jgi:pectate lyase
MKTTSDWKYLSYAIIALLITATASAEQDKVPAFPGAEGFGKYTLGGRGGEVYTVTILDDAGPGSLRHAIESAKGSRTIVFNVGGTITLETPLVMEEKHHITIAGQTAPGKGITLRDQPFVIHNCEHVIVRYLRVRLGDENKPPNSDLDVMTVDYNDHVILDHLSLSWGIDGNSDYRGNKNMTLQWLLYSEGLNNSLHGDGEHAMATSLRDPFGNTTVHHNIYSTSRSRHPTIGSGVPPGDAHAIVDFRNCVNYNWRTGMNIGGVQMNVIANYFRPGPSTPHWDEKPMQIKDRDTTRARGYAAGNVFDGMPEAFNQDNFAAILYTNRGKYMSTTREAWELEAPVDCEDFGLETQSAEEAYEACLQQAGASLVRDTVDERVIANIRERKGNIIDSQSEVGGWDPYPAVHRPEGWDTDGDGMPDEWEFAEGLDPENGSDGNEDGDGNGYTNLEAYLNGLCAEE